MNQKQAIDLATRLTNNEYSGWRYDPVQLDDTEWGVDCYDAQGNYTGSCDPVADDLTLCDP